MPPLARRATETDRDAWDAFIVERAEADLLQSWAWGACTALAGEPPVRILIEDGGRIRGVAQALLRPAGFGRQVAYVPHGPIWDRGDPNADRLLAWLLQALRSLARRERALVVKVDPRAEPGEETDVVARLVRHGLLPAEALQAQTTRIVPLLDGGPRLMSTWHPDARRLSRRAEREGVVVEIDRAGDPAAIATFHRLLTVTAEREGGAFRVREPEFLSRLATELATSGGWYLAIARAGPGAEDPPLAAMAFPRIGSRAYYLYGASLRDRAWKHKYAAYGALAVVLRTLAADGVASVDMWGVNEPGDATADPAWEGFSAFKRTFGGTPLRHPGLFDLVTDPFWYRVREFRARLRRGSDARAAHSPTARG